ncbi:hypothetical protein LG277_11850 [Vreelandella aquamarina]
MRQLRRGATRRTQPSGAFDRWLNLAVSVAVGVALLVGLIAVLAHLLLTP